MKVLHITTMDFGGAGLAVLRIHVALEKLGVDSKVLVLTKIGDSPDVISFLPQCKNRCLQGIINRVERYKRNIWKRKNPIVKEIKDEKISDKCFFTLPISPYQVEKHPLVKGADVIHLHWIQNFINYPSFFQKIKQPCVWTFHDENIGLGGFHYLQDYVRFYERFKRYEDYARGIKQDSLPRKQNVRLVPLSRVMNSFVENVPYCCQWEKTIVHNPVDTSVYQLRNQIECRKLLGLPLEKKVILFVAYNIADRRKGLDKVVAALKLIGRSDILLCCVGGYDNNLIIEVPHLLLGSVNNEHLLNQVYSSADLFVLASDQEAFAQTPLESIASGTPVVATPCSGTEELINGNNGIRCNDFTSEELARCIGIALNTSYDASVMRDDIIKRFSPEHIAQQYIEIYQDMIK